MNKYFYFYIFLYLKNVFIYTLQVLCKRNTGPIDKPATIAVTPLKLLIL